MSDDDRQRNSGMDATLAERFSDLMQAIRFDGKQPRAHQEQGDLIDQIRNALDRRADQLSNPGMDWVANSFSIECVSYESETTRILELRHRDLGTKWALKTIPAAKMHDIALISRLRREAEMGLQLRHPCLMETTMLLRVQDGTPGLLQPWQPITLAAISQKRPITLNEAKALITRLLTGLGELHSKGYVHCDVSPANIFLPDGNFENAKLGDFGISLRLGEKHEEMGIARAGSPEFAPPEQLDGDPAEPMHDLFALGKIVQRLVDKLDGSVNGGLSAFAKTCCDGEASARPSSVQDALHLLV